MVIVVVTGISGSYVLPVAVGIDATKIKLFCRVVFVLVLSCTRRFCVAYCSLHDRATQDTNKRKIQPMNYPDSLHSCVFS